MLALSASFFRQEGQSALQFPETYGRLPSIPFPNVSCLIAALVAEDYIGTQSLYNSSSSLYQFSIQTNLRVGKSEMAWDALFFLLESHIRLNSFFSPIQFPEEPYKCSS